MVDQAARLREIARELQADETAYLVPDSGKRARAQVFSITSGKGGVGKTHLAVNLALKMKEAGHRVLLVDADINLGNTDILLGQAPSRGLADAVLKNYRIRDVIYMGPDDLHVLPGGSGITELTKLGDAHQTRIIRQLEALEFTYDYLIVDTPAGIQRNVLDFVLYSSKAIIIITPEPTSIADAYAMVKMLAIRSGGVKIHIVVNQVASAESAREIYAKFKLVVDRFLNIPVHSLGYMVRDNNVARAVLRQKPLVHEFPRCPASRCINNMMERIVSRGTIEIENYRQSFFRRLVEISAAH